MGHGHAAEHRPNIQLSLGDLLHGLGKVGELDEEAIHIGNELPHLVVRQVLRNGDGWRDLPGTQVMKRCGYPVNKLFFHRDHLAASFGDYGKTRDPTP